MKPGCLIRVFWLDLEFNKFGSKCGLSRQVGFGSGFCPDTKIQKLENNELFIQHFDIMRVLNGGSGSGSVHLHPDPQPWMKPWAWFQQKKGKFRPLHGPVVFFCTKIHSHIFDFASYHGYSSCYSSRVLEVKLLYELFCPSFIHSVRETLFNFSSRQSNTALNNKYFLSFWHHVIFHIKCVLSCYIDFLSILLSLFVNRSALMDGLSFFHSLWIWGRYKETNNRDIETTEKKRNRQSM